MSLPIYDARGATRGADEALVSLPQLVMASVVAMLLALVVLAR